MTSLSNEKQDPLSVLHDARRHIEAGWCKFRLAETAQGYGRPGNSKDAVAWCALGALGAALGIGHPDTSPVGRYCMRALERNVPPGYGDNSFCDRVVAFNNDSRTSQDDILGLFDRTIEAQRGFGFACFRAAAHNAALMVSRDE